MSGGLMSKEKFERTKPVVNVGTIGHVDHGGKAKLTAAVVMAMAANLARKSVDDVNEKLTRGLTKEREDWRKWRQPGSKGKNVINGGKTVSKVNYRKEAKGRDCQVRLPGICNHNPETTVLAHYRMAGLNGVGMKPDDIFGAWACSSCHDECDRRTRKMDTEDVRLAHAEGVFRTQQILRKEGKL
ncbi:hypothetical protein CHBNII4_12490 [Haemophilus influenzae]|nr:hypothetical protein CHBNII4_12490 [Haemophilus influenzae]BBE98705.1 hypothetical protein CHBNIII2_12910 [Haemophilus influenzae]